MNPEMPARQPSPERTPVDYGPSGGERVPQPFNPEKVTEQSQEREQNTRVDRAPVAPIAPAMPMPPQVVPMPAPALPADDNPLIAADDDLIEKEWVDRAKKIISETKDDPYKREREVSKLQADYLRKRYGKEIGVST